MPSTIYPGIFHAAVSFSSLSGQGPHSNAIYDMKNFAQAASPLDSAKALQTKHRFQQNPAMKRASPSKQRDLVV